jgi:hypothetical protein
MKNDERNIRNFWLNSFVSDNQKQERTNGMSYNYLAFLRFSFKFTLIYNHTTPGSLSVPVKFSLVYNFIN